MSRQLWRIEKKILRFLLWETAGSLAMSPVGLEDTADFPGKTTISKTADAGSDAVCDPLPPELAKIIAAWPNLPAPIRRAMLALVD